MIYRTFALLVVAAALQAQARPGDPAVILQAATHQETVVGNLDSAITLYRRVAEDRRASRGTVANALVSLGRAYEMRGQSDAVRAYQRVVNEFGDQGEQAATARQRLAALQAGVVASRNGARDRPADRVYSMVYADLPAMRLSDSPQYDFSPTGDQIVMRVIADPADSTLGSALVVANSGGAVLRTLVPAVRQVSRDNPRWSPDGKYIAYREGSWIGADSSFGAIKVIPVDGGPTRTITTRYYGTRGGVFWTPDSKAVTVVQRRPQASNDIVTIDLDGRVLRTVSVRGKSYLTRFTGYSPDGRWLAFHDVPEGSQQVQMDVWIMAADGGQPIQLTQSGMWHAWPAWGADGRTVYFVSNRSGNQNIWQVSVDPRTGAPQGEAVQVTSYTDVNVRYPQVLQNGKLAFALIRQTGTIRVAAPAKADDTRAVARGTDPWIAPDGRTVYYIGQGVTPPGIFAVSTDSVSTPRRLTTTRPGDLAFQSLALSRDGRFVAYFSQDGKDNVLRTVETATTAVREIVRLDSREHLVPAWSPDGTRLAYTHGKGLFVIQPEGGEARKIAELHDWEGWTVRWSPDGQFLSALAFVAPTDSANAAVIIPASGGPVRRLTPREEKGYKEILEWHPDGRRLTYMYYGHNERGDETRVAYMDARPTTKLLDQAYPIWDYVGQWHPGGRDYYFIASTLGSWSLYAFDERAGASRVIWHHRGTSPGAGMPTFSRDGSMMAWETATTTRQLWVIDGLSSPR